MPCEIRRELPCRRSWQVPPQCNPEQERRFPAALIARSSVEQLAPLTSTSFPQRRWAVAAWTGKSQMPSHRALRRRVEDWVVPADFDFPTAISSAAFGLQRWPATPELTFSPGSPISPGCPCKTKPSHLPATSLPPSPRLCPQDAAPCRW